MKDAHKKAHGKLRHFDTHEGLYQSEEAECMQTAIFTVYSHTFPLFSLTKTSMIVKMSQFSMCSLLSVFHPEISS